VLVMREITGRPEAVDAGTVRLVGTSCAGVRDAVLACLEWFGDSRVRMLRNPYGDGRASERIVVALAGRPFVEFGMEELSGSDAHREYDPLNVPVQAARAQPTPVVPDMQVVSQ
jgi:UDP-N-acetylglucosamine 2-epimerase (non-hydrolysing)